MELEFLTATEVWEGFDPTSALSESSIISTDTADGITCSKLMFTAEETASGAIRACAEVHYESHGEEEKARAAILLLASYPQKNYSDIIRVLVKHGYAVCLLDYCGAVLKGDGKTTFPSDLSYAAYPECNQRLNTVLDSARNTPWFVWSKLARRTLTLMSTMKIIDSKRIGVMGIGEGAHIAWQVAAMDNRVRAFVSIGGTGYLWALDKPRFALGSVPTTDEDRTFSAGIGAETYAKFVQCPTLLITTRSSQTSDVDRAGEILSFVKSERKQLLITNTHGTQITRSVLRAMLGWLRRSFSAESKTEAVPAPTTTFEIIDDQLYLRMHTGSEATSREIYICYGETLSSARHWIKLSNLQKLNTHYYSASVPVYDIHELIVAYSTITYPDGNVVSTPVIGIVPAKQGMPINNAVRVASRVVYDGSMGLGGFICMTDDAVVEDNIVVQQDGPFDIKGITAKRGGLYLYRSAAELSSMSKFATLHFDAYSPEKREISISMYSYPDFKRYTAYTELEGGEFWQKVLLQNADFKSDEGRTLSRFDAMKVIAIADVQGVIFNNFMWI
ncbi:MAG: hypothetical protein HDT36_00700 [Clostridiales bacterium]|nr:hypothetical protein [Clostridiales bacterium]